MRVRTPQQAEKILTAAAQLFATHRFHEARMDDIAALAEVGKGTLYRYFKDKEELYLALLDRAAAGLQSCLCQSLCRSAPPRQQLLAVVVGLLDYFDANPHLFDLIQHAEVMQKSGTEFPWQKTRNKTMTLVKDILLAGQRAGAFRIADPDVAMLMLLGGLRAIIRFGKHPRPAGLAEEVVGWFLDGFGRSDGPRVVDSPSSALHNA